MWGESTTPGLSVWGPRKAKKPEDEPVEALKLPPMSPEKAKDKSGKLVAPSRPTKENQLLVLVEHHLGPPSESTHCKEENYVAMFEKVKTSLQDYFQGNCEVRQ
jgi:hypothetical protein